LTTFDASGCDTVRSMLSPFDTGTLASQQWASLARRLDEALDENHPLELMVELLDRQEKEERGNEGSQS
jgi:hypothetical protein